MATSTQQFLAMCSGAFPTTKIKAESVVWQLTVGGDLHKCAWTHRRSVV